MQTKNIAFLAVAGGAISTILVLFLLELAQVSDLKLLYGLLSLTVGAFVAFLIGIALCLKGFNRRFSQAKQVEGASLFGSSQGGSQGS